MAKNLRDAQKNLENAIDGTLEGGGTADEIKAARKALKAEWDKATPEERKQAKRWGRA